MASLQLSISLAGLVHARPCLSTFPSCPSGEVAAVGPVELQRLFGEVDGWRAWEKARGIDRDTVKARSAPKSIGCSKTFPGKNKIS